MQSAGVHRMLPVDARKSLLFGVVVFLVSEEFTIANFQFKVKDVESMVGNKYFFVLFCQYTMWINVVPLDLVLLCLHGLQ